MKNNKPSGQKVIAVTYGRWSFMRGSDCRHLTGKSLVLLIGGRLWEVVTFQRWSPTKASTVLWHSILLFTSSQLQNSDYLTTIFMICKCHFKIKKSSGHLLVTNWRNIVTRYKFLVTSFHNVNYTTHSMAQSMRFDCLKICGQESV